jgi:hypothetical protein
LPVLSDKGARPPVSESEEEPPRPPLHWIGFGTVAIFAAWLPLTYVAGAVSARVLAARFGKDASADAIALATSAMTEGERARLMAVVALPTLLALAVAAFGGGVVVGRFGSGTGAREAACAGAITALIASIMGWSRATASSLAAAAVMFVVATLFAAWGGRFGASRRPPKTQT